MHVSMGYNMGTARLAEVGSDYNVVCMRYHPGVTQARPVINQHLHERDGDRVYGAYLMDRIRHIV